MEYYLATFSLPYIDKDIFISYTVFALLYFLQFLETKTVLALFCKMQKDWNLNAPSLCKIDTLKKVC